MKLSIWQQFSSNHSAGFVVVGTFNNTQQAINAAKELKKVIGRVSTWMSTLSHNEVMDWYHRAESSNELTPEEIKLQSEYGILWEHSILSYQNLLHLGEAIEVRGNHVIVEEGNLTTWYGPQPINILLKHLGASVNSEVLESKSYSDHYLFVNLSCDLPEDKTLANNLFARFQEDFAAYKSDSERLNKSDTNDKLEELPLNYELLHYKCFDNTASLYEVERNGRQLILTGIAFWAFQSWGKDLDTIVAFLKNENCTNIQYTFHSVECKNNP